MQTPFPKKHTPLIVRVLFGFLTATICVVGGLVLIVIVWVRTMHQPWFRDRLVRFNKQILNPTTLKIAGRRSSIYATIKHVGRRSGREYTTPVVAKPFGDGFVAEWLIFGVPGATAYTDSPAESPLSPLNANLSTREGTAWTSQGDHQSRHRSYTVITSYVHPRLSARCEEAHPLIKGD